MSSEPRNGVELGRIAAFGLESDVRPFAIPESRWPSVLSGIAFHRLTGLAVRGYEEGSLLLNESQANDVFDRHESAMTLALTIEQQLLRVDTAAEGAGVRLICLKGPAVARVAYPTPELRPFGDVDLLVATPQWRSACALLERVGYRRLSPEPRVGFDERFGKAATFVNRSGGVVDLHRTLVRGPFGLWIEPDELMAHTATFDIGGRVLERLDTTGQLVHAAIHASLGARTPLLLPIRDVAQILASAEIDVARLRAWAARGRLAVVFERAFQLIERELGVRLEVPYVGTARSGDRRALAAYSGSSRSLAIGVGTIRAIPGVGNKIAYVAGLLFPAPAFIRSRGDGRVGTGYLGRWRLPFRWFADVARRTHIPRQTGVER
jgi:hypothetical protein